VPRLWWASGRSASALRARHTPIHPKAPCTLAGIGFHLLPSSVHVVVFHPLPPSLACAAPLEVAMQMSGALSSAAHTHTSKAPCTLAGLAPYLITAPPQLTRASHVSHTFRKLTVDAAMCAICVCADAGSVLSMPGGAATTPTDCNVNLAQIIQEGTASHLTGSDAGNRPQMWRACSRTTRPRTQQSHSPELRGRRHLSSATLYQDSLTSCPGVRNPTPCATQHSSGQYNNLHPRTHGQLVAGASTSTHAQLYAATA
jgi:hypothetical protein